jgi:pimeloyl-ACP methyl ester carboxylesterase
LEYQAMSALRADGMADADVRDVASHLARAFAIMRAGGTVDEFSAAVEPLKKFSALRDLGITQGTPEQYAAWQNSMDHQYRPDTALRELHLPVLAIFGGRDVLVDWRESMQIYREAFRAGGNTDLTIKVFRNSDHNIMTPGSDSELAKDYLRTMRSWLKKHVHSRH